MKKTENSINIMHTLYHVYRIQMFLYKYMYVHINPGDDLGLRFKITKRSAPTVNRALMTLSFYMISRHNLSKHYPSI